MQSIGQKEDGKLGCLTGYLVCLFLDTGRLDRSAYEQLKALTEDGMGKEDSLCISAIRIVQEVSAEKVTTTGTKT